MGTGKGIKTVRDATARAITMGTAAAAIEIEPDIDPGHAGVPREGPLGIL
jgi:hypothetical protein